MEEGLIHRTDSINTIPVMIGLLGLFLGVAVYLTDRTPGSVYFLSGFSLYTHDKELFGFLGNHLPSFIHVFSFSLITLGFVESNNRNAISICFLWFFINTVFELGQAFPEKAVSLCPVWFDRFPYLENTASFFRNGTFDPRDIVSFAAGAITAFALYRVLKHKGWQP